MDSRSLLILLAAVLSIGSAGVIECPIEGQVFTTCGSACPATCSNPNPICTKQCVARCECPQGTVLNEDIKACVPLEECPYQPSE